MGKRKPLGRLCRKEFIVVSVNVDVETYLSMRTPRVCLSVHEGVCVGMCLCARAVMGVGRGQDSMDMSLSKLWELVTP